MQIQQALCLRLTDRYFRRLYCKLRHLTPAVVSGYVWFDTDTNGTLNDGEPRLSGYTAYLLKPSDKTAFDASQDKIAFLENLPADQHYRTNNDGSYRFEGLSPQDGYAVVVCDSDTRAYFSAPTNIVTQDDTKIAIREHLDLSLGGEKSDQNFGLYKPVQITARCILSTPTTMVFMMKIQTGFWRELQ